MREITIAELRSNLSKHLGDLPIKIINGNNKKPIAKIVLPDDKDVQKDYIKHLESEIKRLEGDCTNRPNITENVTATPSTMGRCQAPSCPTVTLLNRGDYKEWFNGDLVVKSLLMCPKCIKKYKGMGEQ